MTRNERLRSDGGDLRGRWWKVIMAVGEDVWHHGTVEAAFTAAREQRPGVRVIGATPGRPPRKDRS